tara:strand:- start:38 stop:244 length:207 start_codon:yes stop_codon:yes gene_type:complete
MSKIKSKLSEEVFELSEYYSDDKLDMTRDQHTMFVWALYNAPIHKLREWKKEFKKNKKLREQEESNHG